VRNWWAVIVAEVYQDRGMLKWLPFDALEGYGEMLSKLEARKVEEARPTLCEEHLQAMQYRIEEGWRAGEPLVFTYFENGRRRRIFGCIVGIDVHARVIMLEGMTLAFDALLDVE